MDLEQIPQKLVGDEDERAVSPVIGVILMVAITVILAAVIAAFVLDMGDMGEQAPTTSFEWDQDGDEVTITHQSGDELNPDDISIEGSDGTPDVSSDWATGDKVSAGDSIAITSTGDTIQVVWEGDEGSSQVLDSYEPSDTGPTPAYYSLSEVPESIHTDDGSIQFTVTNDGEETGEQEVSVGIQGEDTNLDSTTVSLNGGAEESVTLDGFTNSDTSDSDTLLVTTADEEASIEVTSE